MRFARQGWPWHGGERGCGHKGAGAVGSPAGCLTIVGAMPPPTCIPPACDTSHPWMHLALRWGQPLARARPTSPPPCPPLAPRPPHLPTHPRQNAPVGKGRRCLDAPGAEGDPLGGLVPQAHGGAPAGVAGPNEPHPGQCPCGAAAKDVRCATRGWCQLEASAQDRGQRTTVSTAKAKQANTSLQCCSICVEAVHPVARTCADAGCGPHPLAPCAAPRTWRYLLDHHLEGSHPVLDSWRHGCSHCSCTSARPPRPMLRLRAPARQSGVGARCMTPLTQSA